MDSLQGAVLIAFWRKTEVTSTHLSNAILGVLWSAGERDKKYITTSYKKCVGC